jgi:hypothetical protein
LVELEFLAAQSLFIRSEIGQRTRLGGSKHTRDKRCGQNQKKHSAHVEPSPQTGNLLRDCNLGLWKSPALFIGKSCKNQPDGQAVFVSPRGKSPLIAQIPSSGPRAMLARAQFQP